MSVLTGSCTGDVDFSVERCWALVADIERAPRWQRTLDGVEVVQRDDRDRALICEIVSDAKVTKLRFRVQLSYDEPSSVRWTLLETDDLDAMEGGWALHALGPSRTRATYSLAVDPGPIGFVGRQLERVVRPLMIGHQVDELARALSTGM